MLGVELLVGAKGNSNMDKGHRAGHLCTLDTCLFFQVLRRVLTDGNGEWVSTSAILVAELRKFVFTFNSLIDEKKNTAVSPFR